MNFPLSSNIQWGKFGLELLCLELIMPSEAEPMKHLGGLYAEIDRGAHVI